MEAALSLGRMDDWLTIHIMPPGNNGATQLDEILRGATWEWVSAGVHVARMLSVGAKSDEPIVELVLLVRRGAATTRDLEMTECKRKKGRFVAFRTLDVTEAPSSGLIWWLTAKVCGVLLTLAEDDKMPLPNDSFLTRLGLAQG